MSAAAAAGRPSRASTHSSLESFETTWREWRRPWTPTVPAANGRAPPPFRRRAESAAADSSPDPARKALRRPPAGAPASPRAAPDLRSESRRPRPLRKRPRKADAPPAPRTSRPSATTDRRADPRVRRCSAPVTRTRRDRRRSRGWRRRRGPRTQNRTASPCDCQGRYVPDESGRGRSRARAPRPARPPLRESSRGPRSAPAALTRSSPRASDPPRTFDRSSRAVRRRRRSPDPAQCWDGATRPGAPPARRRPRAPGDRLSAGSTGSESQRRRLPLKLQQDTPLLRCRRTAVCRPGTVRRACLPFRVSLCDRRRLRSEELSLRSYL